MSRALLAVGISQAQAFEEGNKRAGFASADAFPRLNGMAFVGNSILRPLGDVAKAQAGLFQTGRSRREEPRGRW